MPCEKTGKIGALVDQIEYVKVSVRAKVARQFGHVKVRYREAGEEHRSVEHAVRAVETVDSAQALNGVAGTCVSDECESGLRTGLLGARAACPPAGQSRHAASLHGVDVGYHPPG